VNDEGPKKMLVLHIAVPDFNADDLEEVAGYLANDEEVTPADRLMVVEDWMRLDVALGLVSVPGEKCMNDDFSVFARDGRIVGAELRDRNER
jgi:hypothetical protein